MGLDMWLEKRKKGAEKYDTELAYFRKHSDLHGYFEKLYYERGGNAESFNCVYLPLSKEDLEELQERVKEQLADGETFEASRGFFWGQSDREDWERTAVILKKILRETDFENEEVAYSSWW